MKPVADYLLLTGINHMLFHGMAYSPQDATWPGWLFYASVDFNPNGGLWHDLPAYTAYIARCQSILQRGKPDNDVLLYFPVYDLWQTPIQDTPLIDFKIGGQWLRNSPFYTTARRSKCAATASIISPTHNFKPPSLKTAPSSPAATPITRSVSPPCKLMPPETMAALVKLAEAGATIVGQDGLPTDVPGLQDLLRPPGRDAAVAEGHFLHAAGCGCSAAAQPAGRGISGSATI